MEYFVSAIKFLKDSVVSAKCEKVLKPMLEQEFRFSSECEFIKFLLVVVYCNKEAHLSESDKKYHFSISNKNKRINMQFPVDYDYLIDEKIDDIEKTNYLKEKLLFGKIKYAKRLAKAGMHF